MNKIVLSILALFFCMPTMAQQRTDEAMLYAAQKQWRFMCRHSARLSQSAVLEPLMRTEQLGVFGTAGQGFVITARDKNFPAVLAYSDAPFPSENIPDGL